MSESKIYSVIIVTKGGEVYSMPITFDETYKPTRWLDDRRMYDGGVTLVDADGDIHFFSFDSILKLTITEERTSEQC